MTTRVEAGAMAWRQWVLASLLAGAAVMPARAGEPCPRYRDIDCAAAVRAVEAAIASDPWLVLLEEARRRRLAELQRVLAPQDAAAMAQQDETRRRARVRDLYFAPDGALEPEGVLMLRRSLEWWLIRLIRAEENPPDGIAGLWAGPFAEARIRPLGGGRYVVEADAAAADNLSWTCEFEGEGVMDGNDTLTAGTEGDQVSVRREGAMLRLASVPRPDRSGFDHCGAMGSLNGLLFRIGEAE